MNMLRGGREKASHFCVAFVKKNVQSEQPGYYCRDTASSSCCNEVNVTYQICSSVVFKFRWTEHDVALYVTASGSQLDIHVQCGSVSVCVK